MVHVCVWSNTNAAGQWTRLPLEDVIKTLDNVGGDYSEGIKCILSYIEFQLVISELQS